jgi:hypothetical protein
MRARVFRNPYVTGGGEAVSELRLQCPYPMQGLRNVLCGKAAQGRRTAKTTSDGQPLFHCECDAGHRFHTDDTGRYYFECDCRSRYAYSVRPTSEGGALTSAGDSVASETDVNHPSVSAGSS